VIDKLIQISSSAAKL